jgi:tRNA-dihydrouridine synthase B
MHLQATAQAWSPALNPVKIGPYEIATPLALAPMAGVTDLVFRVLCKKMGAGMAATEMTTSDASLWNSAKSKFRMDHTGEPAPIIVQIAGADPAKLADAARHNVDHGAQIIDINMGCPAKKVCNVMAGSALLQDEPLVARILDAVVKAVNVPVTLKIRTGWNHANRNGVVIAKLAEAAGIQALAVHGRTRVDLYQGEAEYDTIAAIKQAVRLPIFANGDIDSPEKALLVLQKTGVDGLMIGRAAQGRPWIFGQLAAYLQQGVVLPAPDNAAVCAILCGHLRALYGFYGEELGLKIARKHIGWYAKEHPERMAIRDIVLRAESADIQLALTEQFFTESPFARLDSDLAVAA